MAGAYVAKLDLAYSLLVTGPGTMLPGAGIAVVASFRLNGSSGTIEPANRTITWTATVDGSPVDVKISGGFDSSTTSEASKVGVYWLSSVTILLDDIGSAVEQEVIITGSGAIGGISVSDQTIATALGYSLLTTGTSSILSNGTALCLASFRANLTERTAEPSNKTITWSAIFEGNPVNLRVGGTGSWATTATDEVAGWSDFWEKVSALSFQIVRPILDTSLTITGAGVIAGLAVNDSFITTIRGWPEIEYTVDAVYPYLVDWGIFFLWRVDFEIWVKDIPTGGTDWYKFIRYQMWWDGDSGVVSETVIDETGTDPGEISIDFSQTGTTNGEAPWTGSSKTLVKVKIQQPDKKYILKNSNRIGTVSTQQNTFHCQVKESTLGNIVAEETRETTVNPQSNTVTASIIEEDLSVVYGAHGWI